MYFIAHFFDYIVGKDGKTGLLGKTLFVILPGKSGILFFLKKNPAEKLRKNVSNMLYC